MEFTKITKPKTFMLVYSVIIILMPTMFPLMQPTLENIAEQIYVSQSLENITYDDENQYTSQVILNAIESALAKATISEGE